ncbi:MAG: hypothetical protein NC390_04015 [Fusobacterium sp.]|nr:hypothetical protein [Fusobacterium sp.]
MTDIFVHIDSYILNMQELKACDKIVYARIVNMGNKYYDTNMDELTCLTGYTPQTIYKRLNEMVDMGLLAKRELIVKGNVPRTIYVALIDENGPRDLREVEMYLDEGEERMRQHYNKDN